MALGYLTLSSNTAGALSTWNGYESGYGEVRYTTPTTDGQAITVTIPAEMQNATFNSATLSYTVSSASGTRHVRFNGEGQDATNALILQRLTTGGNLNLYFSFRATGGAGGEGSHSASCTWANISIAVDYTPASGITNSLTVSSAGSAVYAIEKKSLAYGESCSFSITARPTIAISRVTAEISAASLSYVETYSADKSISVNSASSLSFTMQIPAAMNAAMSSRVYAAQIRVSFLATNGNTYASVWVNITNASGGQSFKLLKTRSAPVISNVSWGESGTNYISTYGNLIAGKTVPTISFNVTLDTAADSGIGYESRVLSVGEKTYMLSANGGVLEAIATGGSIDYTITVTDSYGQVGTASGSLTVLTYTAPTLSDVAISRYVSSLNTQGQTVYELDDDGNKLWFDASIAVQTTLGNGTNKWSLKITPAGGTGINVLTNSSLATKTYTHDRNVLTGTYANTTSFDFTVELSDAFTTITYAVNVPKAGGILNIETTGVAVGMRSTGTDAEPLFQAAYPAHFLGGVYGADGNRLDEVHDTGWVALTLTNCNQASGWAACAVRVKEGVVFVRGAVTLSASMTSSSTASRQLTTLPTGCRPAQNMLVNSGPRSNYACIEIDADGAVKLWNRIGAALGTSEVISLSAVFPAD